MAKEIIINNPAFFFKKSIEMNELIEGTDYIAGYQDSNYRFTESPDQENSDVRVLYNCKCITRGIYIDEFSSSKVHLRIPMPAAQEDFEMLVDLTKRIADRWKVKTVQVEGEQMAVSELDQIISADALANRVFLKGIPDMMKDKEIKSVSLACAKFPIVFAIEHIASFAEDYSAFSKYLHERQSINAFYTAPQYRMGQNGIKALYTIIQGAFILPDDPFISVDLADGSSQKCVEATVVFAGANYEEEGEDAQLTFLMNEFMEFVAKVPESHKCQFDFNHTLYYNLSFKDMTAIFNGEKTNCGE